MNFLKLFLLSAVFFVAGCRGDESNEAFIVRTISDLVKIRFGDQVSNEKIPFETITSNDTIFLSAFEDPFLFGIYTDTDSLEKKMPVYTSLTLEVVREGYTPVVIVVRNGFKLNPLTFQTNPSGKELSFRYHEDVNSPYLQKLRAEYPVDSLAASGETELEKVRHIASWVHGLWEHDGMNEPAKRDALFILEEVKKGQRFRCVEYEIVLTACLNAVGLKSRTFALKTKDSGTSPSGAGHVLMEVYLNDLDKWIMVDPQFDMIPHLDNVPLNAVELQKYITEQKKIGFWTSDPDGRNAYISWIYPYLYYFSFSFDNREGIPRKERLLVDGKTDLMLVPEGAQEPTVFQIKYPIDYCIYTNSLADFYRKPEGANH